jgi:FAD/FMN-containing dehydrogenase
MDAWATLPKSLVKELQSKIQGDVCDQVEVRKKFRRDTSIFEKMPSLVVYPKHARDIVALIDFIRSKRESGMELTLTARSAGTDMTGGPLTSSVLMVTTKYMNHLRIEGDRATVEPGMYYRDFEKETKKHGLLMPSFPASKNICALGGMVNNNSGGELTLRYGKTEKYVEEMDVVLSDGSRVILKELSETELEDKKKLDTLEGKIYRDMHALIEANLDTIQKAKPTVSKNSSGYALWSVYDQEKRTFNLAKLFVGAQGTLGIMTNATLKLIKPKEHRAMLVVFLNDLKILPEIVKRIHAFNPESFESYDDHTMKLAIRLLPGMLMSLGFMRFLRLGFSFIPELMLVLKGGVPKLILMAEFAEDSADEALKHARDARLALEGLPVETEIAKNERAAEKFWIIRRESFNLLRKNLQGYYASPFIDDCVVHPEDLPTFLPELNKLLEEYRLVYTIAGHVGDGNFHIIPLMNLSNPESRKAIEELTPRVYDLVLKYKGSISGEHNDGIIRTPYISKMFGEPMARLFLETKKIFDPENMLNPGKKVGGKLEDIHTYMITSHTA